jgi:hypothetical protein
MGVEPEIVGQSENSKQNRDVNLLQQAMLVHNWIMKFEPKQINDTFSKPLKVPNQLKELSQETNGSISLLEAMRLSPNNKHVNQSLKLKTHNLMGLTGGSFGRTKKV